MNDAPPASRRTCMVLFGAFLVSLAVFGVLAYLLGALPHGSPMRPQEVTGLRPILYGVGAACLLAAATFIRARTAGLDGAGAAGVRLCAPEKLQANFLAAMALSEACALFGVLLALVARSGLQDYLPFAVVAALVDVAVILPRVRLYWDEWEQRSPRG